VSYDPLSHSRHSAGDKSTIVGNEIMQVSLKHGCCKSCMVVSVNDCLLYLCFADSAAVSLVLRCRKQTVQLADCDV